MLRKGSACLPWRPSDSSEEAGAQLWNANPFLLSFQDFAQGGRGWEVGINLEFEALAQSAAVLAHYKLFNI